MTPAFLANAATWKAIDKFGLSIVLTVVLTGFLMWTVLTAHASMAIELASVKAQTIKNGEELQQLDILINISRQTCLNTAPDAAARRACVEK